MHPIRMLIEFLGPGGRRPRHPITNLIGSLGPREGGPGTQSELPLGPWGHAPAAQAPNQNSDWVPRARGGLPRHPIIILIGFLGPRGSGPGTQSEF